MFPGRTIQPVQIGRGIKAEGGRDDERGGKIGLERGRESDKVKRGNDRVK